MAEGKRIVLLTCSSTDAEDELRQWLFDRNVVVDDQPPKPDISLLFSQPI